GSAVLVGEVSAARSGVADRGFTKPRIARRTEGLSSAAGAAATAIPVTPATNPAVPTTAAGRARSVRTVRANAAPHRRSRAGRGTWLASVSTVTACDERRRVAGWAWRPV